MRNWKGREVKDSLSGLVGKIVAKCEYLTGCIQYEVQPPAKDGAYNPSVWVDDMRLVPLTKGKMPQRDERSWKKGGPPAGPSGRSHPQPDVSRVDSCNDG